MTETTLIYLLISLTLARLFCHARPRLLATLSRVRRERLLDGVDSVVWAGVVALFLIHFVVRSFYIPSGSMLPTLHINDFILVNELVYDVTDPVRGDIVVFHPPGGASTPDKTDLIKRVVGLPYDSIEIKDGTLYLNGQAIDEPFIKEPIFKNFGPKTVGSNEIFVMGDNRNDSKDSRYIGTIPYENLVGRAELIFYPVNRIRVFNFRQ